MSKTIVNLMPYMIELATEEILNQYSNHYHRKLLTSPRFQQKLQTYVLSRIPGHYAVVEEDEVEQLCSVSMGCSDEHRQQIESLIHQGIQTLLSLQAEIDMPPVVEEHYSPARPSSWFG